MAQCGVADGDRDEETGPVSVSELKFNELLRLTFLCCRCCYFKNICYSQCRLHFVMFVCSWDRQHFLKIRLWSGICITLIQDQILDPNIASCVLSKPTIDSTVCICVCTLMVSEPVLQFSWLNLNFFPLEEIDNDLIKKCKQRTVYNRQHLLLEFILIFLILNMDHQLESWSHLHNHLSAYSLKVVKVCCLDSIIYNSRIVYLKHLTAVLIWISTNKEKRGTKFE